MPIQLTTFERRVAEKLAAIKKQSGSHSPSPAMLAGIKGVAVKHDFCFLSNPHATDLFLKYWKRDFGDVRRMRKLVEPYPSQNRTLAQKLVRSAEVPAENIFVGNGATEIIQAVLQNFTVKRILVPIPTFSPYLEFAPKGVKILHHKLQKGKQFTLSPNNFIANVRKEKPDTVVIINPNNPDGGYINHVKLRALLQALCRVPTVAVDESFAHFAGEQMYSASRFVKTYPNLIVIKSLSKDFGIAGLRLGYAVMSEKRIAALLRRGYLWNVSGFGEYFLGLLDDAVFMREYERARLRAIRERDEFFSKLSRISGMKAYTSRANMFLLELMNGSCADDLMVRLLVKHGIYIRTCYDKVGLSGEFVRIASRRGGENNRLVQALARILSE